MMIAHDVNYSFPTVQIFTHSLLRNASGNWILLKRVAELVAVNQLERLNSVKWYVVESERSRSVLEFVWRSIRMGEQKNSSTLS